MNDSLSIKETYFIKFKKFFLFYKKQLAIVGLAILLISIFTQL